MLFQNFANGLVVLFFDRQWNSFRFNQFFFLFKTCFWLTVSEVLMISSAFTSHVRVLYKFPTATPSTSPWVMGDYINSEGCSMAVAIVCLTTKVFGCLPTLATRIRNSVCGSTCARSVPKRDIFVLTNFLIGLTTISTVWSVVTVANVSVSSWCVAGWLTRILVQSRFSPL